VIAKKDDKVRVALTGPGVVMTSDQWQEWLEERLVEV
jgi:hypothetical protein